MSRNMGSTGLTTNTTIETVVRKLVGGEHFHACTRPGCFRSYRCTPTTRDCPDAYVNGRCQIHLDPPRRRPLWDMNRDPIACCIDLKLITNSKEIASYRLAGPGPWYRCATCGRTHPRKNPSQLKEQEQHV